MTSEGPQVQENVNKHALEVVTKRLKGNINRMLSEIPSSTDLNTQRQAVIANLEDRGQNLFSEHQDAFLGLIRKLSAAHFSSRDEMIEEIAYQFGSLMVAIIPSPEELETKLREDAAESNEWTIVNDALSYALEADDEISLHVPTLITKKPFEMFRTFEEGLHILASRLKTDSRLKNVKLISGNSWIIFDHPDLLKKMGFTVSDLDEKNRKGFAHMSREDFIERYGN